jgi:hypothetical protein
MKNKELIEILSAQDPEADVILQKDPEGNGYSPLSGADPNAVYDAEEAIVYNMNHTAADACMDEDEWEKITQQERCIVLYPKY